MVFLTSTTTRISSGISQGSILGPLLFLVHINDFPQASNFFSAIEASFTVSDLSIDELVPKINLELPSIYNWLCANKLALNIKETKYIVFKPQLKINYNLLTPLILAGQRLEQVSCFKY